MGGYRSGREYEGATEERVPTCDTSGWNMGLNFVPRDSTRHWAR